MPYSISPRPNNKFSVSNTETGRIHAKETSLSHAKEQIRLLNAIEHNPFLKIKNSGR